jgi:hypothetical protein
MALYKAIFTGTNQNEIPSPLLPPPVTWQRKNEFTYKKSCRKKIDDTVIYICIDEWLDWQRTYSPISKLRDYSQGNNMIVN